MTSQLAIYSGQLVWAWGFTYPYWPSIVCAVGSGEITNTKSGQKPFVHVKLCANRKSDWIRLDYVFEFTGYDSYVARKNSKKSTMSEDDFHKAFGAAMNSDDWRKAVVEATFISSKDVGSRLGIFDTLKIIDDISFQLNQITSNITFEGAGPLKTIKLNQRSQSRILPPLKALTKDPNSELQKSTDKAKPNVTIAGALKTTNGHLNRSQTSEAPPTASNKDRRRSEPQRRVTFEEKNHRYITRSRFSIDSSNKDPQPRPITKVKPLSKKSYTTPSKQPSKLEKFENDVLTYQMESHPKEILFECARGGNICKICCSIDGVNDGNLVKCSRCGDHVHSFCLNNNDREDYIQLSESTNPEEEPQGPSIKIRMETQILCFECQPPSMCYGCRERTDAQLKKCDVRSCGRYYHTGCLAGWKQMEFVASKLKCPLHVCHTCFPNRNDSITSTTKFTFCIKCPTAYHLDSKCIPAGTKILSKKQHICIRHQGDVPSLDWCVRCGEEGSTLVCCGSCPKTFHRTCLDESEVSNPFLCDDCVNANHPLYGQMIVAKYKNHLWWPAVIVPTFKIPIEMYDKPPKEHKFCIRFFQDYEFGWIRRSSVHFYSKSEAAKFLTCNQNQVKAFKQAENWFDKIAKADVDSNNDGRTGTSSSSVSTSGVMSLETSGSSSISDDSGVISLETSESSNISDDAVVISLETNETQSSRKQPQYTKITTVNAVAPAKLIKCKDEPIECSCNSDDMCGPKSTCENREVYMECDPANCGSTCKNQCFQRKTFAAVRVQFMGEKKGFGLVADEFINAGQLVIEYVGELITGNELQRRKGRKQNLYGRQHLYFMTYSKGLYIDAEEKGNESRFVNHSCVPNCETQKWTVNKIDRIGYFALKDIEKGTEITTSYDFDRGELHQCFCGEKKCTGVIGNRNPKK